MINLNRYFKEKDPFWFTVVYLLVLITFIVATIYEPHIRKTAPAYFTTIAWFLILGPVLLTVFHVKNYKTTISSMPRLVSLYLQVVIMFGCIYFVSVAAHMVPQLNAEKLSKSEQAPTPQLHDANNVPSPSPTVYTQNIQGISNRWLVMLNSQSYERKAVFTAALRSLYDSLHFSLMTSSTVGYGDMYPITVWAKLMVDIQVLVSLFLVAFGAGSFFAQKDN